MNLITALIQSLYSVRFYRQVVQSSVGRGFLYLTLWAAIFAMLVSMVTAINFMPEANRFLEWFRQEMPVVEWRPEGLKMDKASPYEMKHPRYGHIMTLDMNQTDIAPEKMGGAPIFVTATKIYVRKNSEREFRIYDLLSPDTKVKEPIVMDAERVRQLERTFKPWVIPIIAVATFLFFFIWKLLAALFYSLIALLINLFRTPRLNYESLLNATMFAMTATTWINILQIFLGGLIKMPFLLSLLINTIYLYLAVKFTEEPSTA